MTDSLENILARKPAEAAPVQDVTTEETPVENKPETTEAPEASESQAQETTQGEGNANQQKMVPHEALHAEKQKVKRYTEQVASFEQTLKERDDAWERRFNQMLEKLGPNPEQAPQADWYADPQAAFQQGLTQAVSPIEQKLANFEFQIMRMSAEQRYGADKIREFEAYAEEAAKRGDPEIRALAVEMRASSDPIGVGLKWYEKKTFDPEAERKRIAEEERQKVLEEMKLQQTQTPNVGVMPSNLAGARNVGSRSGPNWGGPPSLQDIFKR